MRLVVSWIAGGLAALLPLTALAADPPPRRTEAMSFSLAGNGGNCLGCEWVAAEGLITADAPAAFAAFLKQEGWSGCYSAEPVMLDSPGGDAEAAMALGRALRAAGCTTSVGRTVPDPESADAGRPIEMEIAGQCEGACVLAFLGGQERSPRPDQLVLSPLLADRPGLSAAKGLAEGLMLASRIGAYLAEMGADPAFGPRLALAPDAPPQTLGAADLAGLAIDNSEIETRTPWQVTPYRGGAVAVTTHRIGPQGGDENTLTLFCRRGKPAPAALMLSRRWGADKNNVPSPEPVTLGLAAAEAGGQAVERTVADAESRETDDGWGFLTVDLTAAELAALRAGRSLTLSGGVPPNWGTDWAETATLTAADRDVVALALRNCI
ncbi:MULTISPECIES: hypothetical protein [unclassified Inquilinus]|uniref:hypothetical protein n=1 Tax=unclassified Inquilinus TaxID=2645927 RepID=UPI003F8E53D1